MPITQRRASHTRSILLQSAQEVFQDVGYTEANVADVVARARSSVGSMYHHFGGKADLYLALYGDYQSRQEQRAARAIRAAVDAGERDGLRLFLAGARSYLDGCWIEREVAVLFLSGDWPAGFDGVVRARFGEWTVNGQSLFRNQPPPSGAHAFVLTSVVQAAGREVAVAADEQSATAFITEVLALLERLGQPMDRDAI